MIGACGGNLRAIRSPNGSTGHEDGSMRKTLMLGGFVTALFVAGCGGGATPEASPTAGPGETGSPSAAVTTAAPTGSPVTEAETAASSPASETITVARLQEVDTTADGQTVHCADGGEVNVHHTAVTVTGHCHDVDVYSSDTTVRIAEVRDLDVYGSGSTIEVDQSRDLEIAGDANQVTIGSVREVEFEGNNNTVTVQTGSPRVEDEGRGNRVSAAG